MISQRDIQLNRKLFSESDKSMVDAFKVLSDISRYRIFRILAAQPRLSVGNIAKILDISLPLASQHVKILTHANLIQKERQGKKVFPKLEHDNPFVQAIVKTIERAQN